MAADDGELVATEPEHDVGVEAVDDPGGDTGEHEVAVVAAGHLVHVLEVAEVTEGQRSRGRRAAAVGRLAGAGLLGRPARARRSGRPVSSSMPSARTGRSAVFDRNNNDHDRSPMGSRSWGSRRVALGGQHLSPSVRIARS